MVVNIFITNKSPKISARNLAKVHVNKQLEESCQLLANAHWFTDSELCPRLCKPVSMNHPCSVWVRESKEHYRWLVNHARELLALKGEHGYEQWFKHLKRNVPALPDKPLVFPMAVTSVEWIGRRYSEDLYTTYQRYLSWKYDTFQTRTDKKRMPVSFYGDVPAYYKRYTTLGV